MLRRWSLRAACAALVLAVLPSPVSSRDADPSVETVEVTGVATVREGDVAAARDRAIEDALRKAVETAVGTFVESETMVQNHRVLSDSIYSRSEGFVRSYDVISDAQEGALFRVKVSAVVATGELREDVEALGLLLRRMDWPRVLVLIPEENLDGDGGSKVVGTVEAAVIASLRDKEFPVLDSETVRRNLDREASARAAEGDLRAAEAIRRQTGAEVLVTGRASAQEAGTVAGTQMRSYQASAACRAVKLDSGEVLASASGTGKAVHLNAAAGGNEALSQAASQMADELVSRIAEQWAKEVSGSRLISIAASGLSRAQAEELAGALRQQVRGVVEVHQREFDAGEARLDVRIKGDAEALVQTLDGLALSRGRLRVTSASANRVAVRLDAPGT